MNEETIADAIGVSSEGEKWFKQQSFEADFSKYLLPGFEKLDWKNGIHVKKLKPMWKTPLEMIQDHITGEGRYDRVLRCHLHFLMHLSGEKKMNLPYYLFKCIQRIIARVHSH